MATSQIHKQPLSTSPNPTNRPVRRQRHGGYQSARETVAGLLAQAGITLNGSDPWDFQLHDERALIRILAEGSLGLGETYIDGAWDCERLDEFFARVLSARLDEQVGRRQMAYQALRARLLNLQNLKRVWQVGKVHYDLGNDFFEKMLGQHMAYTCGYWEGISDPLALDQAQFAKLELIARKLQLRPGMRLLDIGCGWGSLMLHLARHHGVECVGVTISREQAEYGRKLSAGLPVEFKLMDYRELSVSDSQRFDRIASVGMFEHVGHKNHATFFATARRLLREDGLFLLHTIGKNRRRSVTDPWIDRYIFPNGDLPSLGQIADASEDYFVLEDVHNFGADYDRTLMAWHHNFEQAWPLFAERYGERFHRMWRYYLLACAGTFRARTSQLWQCVLSPKGVPGGYRRP